MTGIVFDIDDTLYNRQVLFTRAAEEALGTRIDNKDGFVRIFYEQSDLNTADLEAGKITTLECNAWRYEQTFRLMGLPYKDGDGLKAAGIYYDAQRNIRLSPDMTDVLDKLSSAPGVKLAVLTAGRSSHQWRKFDMLGLDKWISRGNVIVGGDVGISKPDVRVFRLTEERLGLRPGDIWMIGDSYKHDIEGALNAGWHAVWLDRRGVEVSGLRPDHKVTTDEGLIQVIRSVLCPEDQDALLAACITA